MAVPDGGAERQKNGRVVNPLIHKYLETGQRLEYGGKG
jgi:hypothetical protein